uniref:Uncharacterized protein n=1 Tax=Branchiostoma floridae TaxID=7739 RepID=C3XQW0_BRAFL|eukprot:XP_002613546.1 hypothetical protein BRAFLDRAFT_71814 [Branchiostoma floridae]
MAYSSCMPGNKGTLMSGIGSSQYPREGRTFSQGAMSRGRPSRPVIADHSLLTQNKAMAPGNSYQPSDWERGNKRSSRTSIVADLVQVNTPRQDRGRSAVRTTERRGSAARSSSCGAPYSSREDTKTVSPPRPLADVLKSLKDGRLRSELINYMESHEKLKTEYDNLQLQVSLYKWKLSNAKNLDERLSNLMSTNERYLENVSQKIRPSTLVERFKELESTEWLKAKETMDMRFGVDDQSTFHLLCSTVTVHTM